MSKTIRPLAERKRENANKLYHTPRTPPPIELRSLEKSFILDNVAVNRISDDYSRANPKHGNPIPPYNAFHDKGASPYFKFSGVRKNMNETFVKRKYMGTEETSDENGRYVVFEPVYKYEKLGYCSINGEIMDKFHTKYLIEINGKDYEFGSPKRYLHYRNKSGAGHSNEQIDGHRPFVERVTPIIGYNGPFGYRRNNYKFIKNPSAFGVCTKLPIHSDPQAETDRKQKAGEEYRKRQERLFGKKSSSNSGTRKSSSQSHRE